MNGIRNWAGVALAMMVGAPVATAQSDSPATVFRPVIAELRTKVQIPVLLPSRLPAVLRSPEISDVTLNTAAADSYNVELRYKGVIADAGFAASFSGARAGAHPVRAKHPIRLANGALARFLPVGCGGSCAPANLWWQLDGVLYQIQVELPSDMSPRAQLKVLVATASAMVRLRSDTAAPPVKTPR